MTKPKLRGSFVALITPFQDDGTPDIQGFGRLIEFQAAHGTSALLIMGSTGEVSLLSREERQLIISETVKFKKHGLPLFFGCTGNNTRETIRMVQYAGRAGADGAVITAPSYIHAPVDAALQYFLDVADASPIPIGIYNNPIRVGTDLPAEAILRLADHPNIAIDKEAMARPGQIAQILAADKDLSVRSNSCSSCGLKFRPRSCPYALVAQGSGVLATGGREFPIGKAAGRSASEPRRSLVNSAEDADPVDEWGRPVPSGWENGSGRRDLPG
jgi:4-hydroxy-tetrahydrodipicolinate synthase